MRTSNLLVQALCLTTFCVLISYPDVAQGQIRVEIISPANDTEVEINTAQTVRVYLSIRENPLVGKSVEMTSDLGEVLPAKEDTDTEGIASFTFKSAEVGTAITTASFDDETDTLRLKVVDPDKDGNSAVVPVAPAAPAARVPDAEIYDNPFRGRAELENANSSLPLWVFNDRIGFLGRGGIGIADVARIAANEGLTQITPLGDNIFVLATASSRSRSELRSIARELESRYSDEIHAAGLVANVVSSNQWLLIPDQLIVKVHEGLADDDIVPLLSEFGLNSFTRGDIDERRLLVPIPESSLADALELAAALSAVTDMVQFAEPNFVLVFDQRSDPTADDGFQYQWHHENNGMFATEDADIDSAKAWTFGYGSHDTIIAVIDRGFDITHPDLLPNLWTSSSGIRGINLVGNNPSELLSSSSDPGLFAHGTRAAGVAAARGGNTIGYTGSCPHCQLLLIRTEQMLDLVATAFNTARANGAKVISNSWGYAGEIKAIDDAIDNAVDAGITVVFAMTNVDADNCGIYPDISARHNVIAVSGATDYDARSPYSNQARGYGTCMDVLAPTRGGAKGIGTTSVKKILGVPTSTYYYNFGGTSAATPLVAGIVGLMKDLNPALSPLQVQRILQDTADSVDPSAANYSSEFGFSNPGGIPTHGYGRVNSFEATKLVAPQSRPTASGSEQPTEQLPPLPASKPPGRGGKDLLLRDNDLDWGNTEQASTTILSSPRQQITEHRSVDIKIDVSPFQATAETPAKFVSLIHEEPQPGKSMRVYVRLRNRGPETVDVAELKLHVAIVANALPDLPADFWSRFPNDSTQTNVWHPIRRQKLAHIEYSGASVAGCPCRTVPECLPLSPAPPAVDRAQISMFEIRAMDWDATAGKKLAVLAMVHSEEDPIQAKLTAAAPPQAFNVLNVMATDNNVTLWVAGN